MPDEELQSTTSEPTLAEKLDELLASMFEPGTSTAETERLARQFTALAVGDLGGRDELGVYVNADGLARAVISRLGPLGPSLEGVVRDQIAAMMNGRAGYLPDPAQNNPDIRADPVMMFNGQYVHQTEDLYLSGAGIDFIFQRTYKNQVVFSGPLGANWDHSYNIHLRAEPGAVSVTTGELREETFTPHPQFPNGQFSFFLPPDGVHAIVVPQGDSYVRRSADGINHIFQRDPDWPGVDGHRLERVQDRFGNYLRFRYADGRLSLVEVNSPDRTARFLYDSVGRIATITDHAGRTWRYIYDDFGDLIYVVTPRTDRYPGGLAWEYEYSSATATGLLQHNLLRVRDPAGRDYVANEYGQAQGLTEFNRVVRQRLGNGESLFEYQAVDQIFDHDYAPSDRPSFQTNFVDRNGQVIHFVYNQFGNLLLREERVLEGGRVVRIAERHRYNRDGAVVAAWSAEGSLTQFYLGREDYLRRRNLGDDDLPTDAFITREDRLGFGRVLASVRAATRFTAVSLNPAGGAWGDVFPSALRVLAPDDRVTKFTYEPDYGQITTASDPRLTSSADPNATEGPSFARSLTRWEYRSSPTNPGAGVNLLLSRVVHPTPDGPDGALQDPVIEEFLDYDERGRVRQRRDPGGSVTSFFYFGVNDGPREGYLQRRVVDDGGLGLVTRYEVDVLGRATAVHAPRSQGAAPGGFVTRYVFNELDQCIETVEAPPFGFSTRRQYDRAGQLERQERDAKDESGTDLPGAPEVWTFCHDEQHNLLRQTHGGASALPPLVTKYRYDAADNRVLTVLPAGNRIRRRYDERNQEVAVTVGAGTGEASTSRTLYDHDGHRRGVVSGRGFTTSFDLNVFGETLAERDPLGNVRARDYDKAGNHVLERFFELNATGTYSLLERREYAYDLLNRLIRVSSNLFRDPLPAANLIDAYRPSPGPGRQLSNLTFYDPDGRATLIIDPLLRTTRYRYDGAGRLRVEVDPAGHYSEHTYDPNGNLLRRDTHELVIDPATAQILGERVFAQSFTYDSLDRLSSSTDSLGNTTRFSYDSRGNRTREVDPLGNSRRWRFDIVGRRFLRIEDRTTTGLGNGAPLPPIITRWEYDPNGNIVVVVDALGRQTEQVYDALDRRRIFRHADLTETADSYDPDSNLVARRDPNGTVERFTVDPLNRTTRMDVDLVNVIGGLTIGGETFHSRRFDGLGRCVMEVNDFSSCDIRVNSMGWCTSETLMLFPPGGASPGLIQLLREFEDDGSASVLQYPGGRRVRYHRNALNQVSRIEDLALGANYLGSLTAFAPRDIVSLTFAGRRPRQAVYGNGSHVAWQYDGAGRLIDVSHTDARAAPIVRIQELFDAADNMRVRVELRPAGVTRESFAFDSVYQLTNRSIATPVTLIDPAALGPATAAIADPIPNRQTAIDALIGPLQAGPGPFTWEYDAAGNRVTDAELVQPPDIYTVNALDEYVAAGPLLLTYDRNGNLTGDGTRAYQYDVDNRLVRVLDTASGGDVVKFFHDARGRRVREIMGVTAKDFIYDEDRLIAEYRNGQPFAQYVHLEVQDSPVQMAAQGIDNWYHTDLIGSVRALTDSTGVSVADYDYSPFGRSALIGPYNPWRFAGKRFDLALDAYDFVSREYSPRLGRFLQRDINESALGSNPYSYAGNNPLTYVDPLGRERQSAPSIRRDPVHDSSGAVREPVEQTTSEVNLGHATSGFGVSLQTPTQAENLALSPEERIMRAPGLTDETRQLLLRDVRVQRNMFPARNVHERLTESALHGGLAGGELLAKWGMLAASWESEGEAFGAILGGAGRLVRPLARAARVEEVVSRIAARTAQAIAGGRRTGAAGELPELIIDYIRYPQMADNIWHAQMAGRPAILTHAAGGEARRKLIRKLSLKGIPRILSRDEYPFASSVEAGAGSWIGHISEAEQHAQGGLLSNFLQRFGIRPGDRYVVRVINHPRGPVVAP
jgi:RHS repeat-associated protein